MKRRLDPVFVLVMLAFLSCMTVLALMAWLFSRFEMIA